MRGIRSFAKTTVNAAALLGAMTMGAGAVHAEDGPIIVTGQQAAESPKFTAPLAETPRSVTIIPQQILQKTGVTNLQDALRVVPGITLGSAEGGAAAGDRPFIRGIDSTSDVFVDGIRDSGSTPREIFNLDQIDVARGPGGAFAGRGSTGGSLNLISKTPQAQNFAVGSVTLGTDATVRLTADANYMIGDAAAFRINAMHHDQDVAGRDFVEQSRWGVAPSLALGLGTSTRATLAYYHFQTDDMPDYGVPYLKRQVTDPTYGVIFFGAPIEGHDNDYYGLANRDFRKTKTDLGTLTLERDLTDDLTLINKTRIGKTQLNQVVSNPDDSRNNVVNGVLLRNPKTRGVETETFANVLDLKGAKQFGGIKNSFDFGIEYSKEKTHNQAYAVNGPGLGATYGFPFVPTSQRIDTNVLLAGANPTCSNPGALGATAAQFNCTSLNNPNPNDPWVGTVTRAVGYLDTETEVFALYAFNTFEFNEFWEINAGIRWDNYETRQTGLTAPAPTASGQAPLTRPAPISREDDFVNWTLGVVYHPVKEASLYLAYGTSSNPSGEGGGDASQITTALSLVPPEENESYEAGVKWQLFDERLLATGAAFHTRKKNARVIDPTGVTQAIGEQEINGLEFTATGQITPKWGVFAGYTYLDSEITDGGFLDRTTITPIAVNTPPRFVASPTTGKQFLLTPKHSFSGWTDYKITNELQIGAGATYMSKRYADAVNRIELPDYWRFDAMASYKLNDHVDFQMNLQNITDERYVTQAHPSHFAVLAAGRSALFTMNVRY